MPKRESRYATSTAGLASLKSCPNSRAKRSREATRASRFDASACRMRLTWLPRGEYVVSWSCCSLIGRDGRGTPPGDPLRIRARWGNTQCPLDIRAGPGKPQPKKTRSDLEHQLGTFPASGYCVRNE